MANTAEPEYDICELYERVPYRDQTGEISNEEALVAAAAIGESKTIVDLLADGTSVDSEEYNKLLFYASKNYMTPLQIAAANGNVKCVRILIDHRADVNAKDRFDVTALHMAAERGHYSCLKALLDASADCSLPTKFSKSGSYTAVPHLGGTTPLHLAASNNHVGCVKELIQYGADYNAVDECGRTSLYIAAQAGFDKCVLAHLKNAVGRDILSLPGFETSDTPLHFAVNHKMVDCVRELLYLGSDVNHINDLGCSPLHLALAPSNDNAAKNMEILKLLILEGYNTDVNLHNAGDFTPLHYVCFNGCNFWRRRPKMAKFLIAYGANVNIKNNRGSSLLECELKSSDKDCEILEYVVKSMLNLPPLKNLNICSQRESSIAIITPNENRARHLGLENETIANIRRLPPPNIPEFIDPHGEVEMNRLLEMNLPVLALANIPPIEIRHQLFQNLRQRERNPVRQPIPFHMLNAFEVAHDNGRNLPDNDNEIEINAHLNSCVLKKHIWYEQIASNPRTLQHTCRYVVRETLGAYKLKHIKKLPIPSALQSYLLFNYEE